MKNIEFELGRLLAVADEIEHYERPEVYMTAVKFHWTKFFRNPARAWEKIEERIKFKTLLPKNKKYLLETLEEIKNGLDWNEVETIENLSGLTVLGYDSEKAKIWNLNK